MRNHSIQDTLLPTCVGFGHHSCGQRAQAHGAEFRQSLPRTNCMGGVGSGDMDRSGSRATHRDWRCHHSAARWPRSYRRPASRRPRFFQGPPSSLDFSTSRSFFTKSPSDPCSADSNPNPYTFLSSPPRANHPSSGWIRTMAFGLEIETPCFPKSQSEVTSTYSSFSMSPRTLTLRNSKHARAPVS